MRTPAPAGPSPAGAAATSAADSLTPGATAYTVEVEAGFPLKRRLGEVAHASGIPSWRVIEDNRRFLRGGDVTFEVVATLDQIHTFESLWSQMREGIWGSTV
ncbi:MAG: hypothetical protein QNJ98_08650 [Planctomycetota bacterium]|nr:hypothetical protein [Planctomycetota bacterium]